MFGLDNSLKSDPKQIIIFPNFTLRCDAYICAEMIWVIPVMSNWSNNVYGTYTLFLRYQVMQWHKESTTKFSIFKVALSLELSNNFCKREFEYVVQQVAQCGKPIDGW